MKLRTKLIIPLWIMFLLTTLASGIFTEKVVTDLIGHHMELSRSTLLEDEAISRDNLKYKAYFNAIQATGDETKTTIRAQIALRVVVNLLLSFVILAFFINRIVVRPLDKCVEFAKRISEGEFTDELKFEKKDEISVLVQSLNTVVKRFNTVFYALTADMMKLTSTSNELAAISERVLTGSEQSSERAHSVATATEEMSTNLNTVAAAGEEASTNIKSTSHAVEQMSQTVNEIAGSARKAQSISGEAVDLVTSSSERVDALGSAAFEIGEVTEVITSISEKTDLLALNATIEAARAGTAGKGFAVVANEIKDLANQTAQSTGEIQSKIKDIQNSTESTVNEIKGITNVIVDVNDAISNIAASVEEQAVTTREITVNINQAAQGITEVAENVIQSSGVSTEIAGDISSVSQATAQFTEESVRLNSSSNQLKDVAMALKGILQEFKISAAETQKAQGDITDDVQVQEKLESLIIWDDSLILDIEQIDQQHRRLIDLINQLHAAMKNNYGSDKVGEILGGLIEYTAKHFKAEEDLFEQYRYPEADSHKTAHVNLVEKVVDFQQQFEKGEAFVSMELMDFLKDWLVTHIKGTDKKYAPFLIENGVK